MHSCFYNFLCIGQPAPAPPTFPWASSTHVRSCDVRDQTVQSTFMVYILFMLILSFLNVATYSHEDTWKIHCPNSHPLRCGRDVLHYSTVLRSSRGQSSRQAVAADDQCLRRAPAGAVSFPIRDNDRSHAAFGRGYLTACGQNELHSYLRSWCGCSSLPRGGGCGGIQRGQHSAFG